MSDHIFEEENGVLKYKYLPFKLQGPKQKKAHILICMGCDVEYNGFQRVVFKGRVSYKMYLHKKCDPPKPYTEEPDFHKVVVRDAEGEIIIDD